MSGQQSRPASVIRPILSIRLHRSLFSSDHALFFWRGVNLCIVQLSESFFVVLSIHPKHKASSTASTYQNVSSSFGRPRFTVTQHSSSVAWFFFSHCRSSSLFFASSKFFNSVMLSCFSYMKYRQGPFGYVFRIRLCVHSKCFMEKIKLYFSKLLMKKIWGKN